MIFKAGNYPQGDWPKERVQKMAGWMIEENGKLLAAIEQSRKQFD
jgi:hypothetical protein